MAEKERILIIDDEDSCRMMLTEWLRSYGYDCEEASNGSEGLDRALDEDWDLILSDIMMPGLNGIELVRLVKAFKSSVPVVMISAVRSSDMIQSAFREGAYDFIFKPFNLSEFEMVVARALEKNRLTRENEQYRKTLEKRVAEQAEKIRSLSINSVIALARALEAKDHYTSGHSQRVAEYGVLIAHKLGLDYSSHEQIRVAGLLHDIGKIGLKESILNKPDRLSDAEFAQVKAHPCLGTEILQPIVTDLCVLHGVKHHHERYDGAGYPDGLVGDDIPLEARILAVADCYDAKTTARAYRPACDHAEAIVELKRCAGTQFDPMVVEAFTTIPETIITDILKRIPAVRQWAYTSEVAEEAAMVVAAKH